MTEQIRILLVKCGNISESELARRMGTSPQNLHNKMKRDNFTVKDLEDIAKALDCTLDIKFISNSTNMPLQVSGDVFGFSENTNLKKIHA